MAGDDKNRGVGALNREFARYEQVSKEQSYRLAEAGEEEAFDEEYRIRSCDMKDPRFPEELGAALSEIGFAILEGNGIDPALFDEADRRVAEFFEETPLEAKMRFRAQRYGSVNQGYFPLKETSDIHPDLVEAWVFCRRAFETPQLFWPDPSKELFFRRLVTALEELVLPVMQAILQFMGEDPHLYDAKLRGTNFGLRLNYYPPVDAEDDALGAGRLLGHEDVDLFTLLPAPQIEGLQVLNRKNGKWVRLIAPRGSVILNAGDYLQRITNDLLPSTTHRVSKPRDPDLLKRGRTSFPLNVYLWEHETLEVLPGIEEPKYPPINAEEFHTSITAKYYGDDYAVGPRRG